MTLCLPAGAVLLSYILSYLFLYMDFGVKIGISEGPACRVVLRNYKARLRRYFQSVLQH